ncbi:bacterial transcriptional activator domain-containing protein [Micromonospora sp. RTP1Z1]|uniref:bacterial transcriptional activator domain-containing protein n=1 Tax=Micromonospora sp. RTP1Z1 TaxID=2994043 RepID=UPI0029C7119C|nr:bacterial transcriptional activator domain-containing protein [Micromonospora sp. RTP1Z1]
MGDSKIAPGGRSTPSASRSRATTLVHTSVLRVLAQHAPGTDQKLVYLMRLVHRDPYDEDAHPELVQVLRAAGRHGEAQRRYRTYAERMRELGITPAGGFGRRSLIEHPA